jgi:hypothetical protein
MKQLANSYAKHFFPLIKRTFILLFRNRNRALVDVTELNKDQKNGKSVLKLKTDLSNILFLKINKNYFPIFHDNVTLEIIIPLDSEKEKIDIKGIGIFKTSRTIKIDVTDVHKLELNSFNFQRSGEFNSNVKTIRELSIQNTISPNLNLNSIEVNHKKIKINTGNLPLTLNKAQLTLPNIQNAEFNEEELIFELNKTK